MKNSVNKNVPRLRFPAFKNAPVWKEKKLGDIGEFKTSSVNKKIVDGEKLVQLVNYMNVYKHEDINNTTIENLMTVSANETQLRTSNLKKGDILFTPSSETPDDIGHSVVVFENLKNTLYSYHLMRFRPKLKLDILYSHYFCNIDYVLKQISRVATGSTRFTISISGFSNIKIKLPSTVQEQQKIADCLTSLDELIDAQSQKVLSLKQHKKGLMQQLFPAKGKNTPALRFPEFKNAPAWEEKKIENVGEIITGKTPSTKKPELWNGDIEFITPTDIYNKHQQNTSRKVVKTEKMKILPIGSIAYTCIASIGKMTMTTKKSITNQQINSIIVNQSNSNEFIYYLLLVMTPYIKSTQANTTFAIINKQDFSKLKIFTPKPPEQQKIANCLTSLDELIDAQSQKLLSLKQHKKGLMQKLFPEN